MNRENNNGVKSPSIQNTDNDQKQNENKTSTISVDNVVDLSRRFVDLSRRKLNPHASQFSNYLFNRNMAS